MEEISKVLKVILNCLSCLRLQVHATKRKFQRLLNFLMIPGVLTIAILKGGER